MIFESFEVRTRVGVIGIFRWLYVGNFWVRVVVVFGLELFGVMKVPKGSNGDSKGSSGRRQRGQRVRKPKDEQVTELLKMCLMKVCQLQEDLQRSEDFENDPQAAGYAACATEALRFLASQGLPNDHPVVQTLAEKLVQDPQL